MKVILKKLNGNNKGAAMIVALIVVLCLSLLGATLWQYFMVDTNHTMRDEWGMQAYYIARAGADSVAQYIMKNPKGFDDTEMENFINNLSAAPESDLVTYFNNKGSFKIKFTKNINGNYEIRSAGTVKDVTKSILLTMKPIGAPLTPDGATSAAALKWLHGGEKGQEIDKDTRAHDYEPLHVSFHTANKNDMMIDQVIGNTIIGGLGIYFEQPVTIENRSSLTINSNLIVFRGRVVLNEKDRKTTGQIVLHVNANDTENYVDPAIIAKYPDADTTKNYGRVYFLNGAGDLSKGHVSIGAYYFPDGCSIPCYDADGNVIDGWTEEDAGLLRFNMISGYDLIWD